MIQQSGSWQQPVATNFASAYLYASGRPHLPSQIGNDLVAYDASGNPTQWRKGGTAITGNASALTATLTLPAIGLAAAGSYDVVVTNSLGTFMLPSRVR